MSIKIEVKKQDKVRRGWSWADRAEFNRATRVYVWPKDESVLDNLKNRRLRPHNIWKNVVMPQVLKKLELPANTKMRWSQKAGCGCGCSPGFILSDYHTFDVHVNLSTEQETVS